jgi:hypothetical protein
VAIKHGFVSLVTDIGGPTYVQPTHWNQPHLSGAHRIYDFDPGITPATMAMPSTAGPTGYEFYDNTSAAQRGGFDFTYIDSIQLFAGVASIANGPAAAGSAALRFQYAPSGFPGSWYSFDATGGSAPFVSMATAANASLYLASANGLRFSATVTVSAAAKALPQPLMTRIAGYGGGGSAVLLGKLAVFGL